MNSPPKIPRTLDPTERFPHRAEGLRERAEAAPDYSKLTREELIERLQAAESRPETGPSQFFSRAAAEGKYRTLFENMVEEVHFWRVIRDANGVIVNWRLVDINPAAERSWGRKRADVVGKTADEIFSTALTVFMPIVRKIFSDSKPYEWETYFEDLKQHMKMSSVAFGEFFFTTGFDITEIKESQLRQEKLGAMARLATEASGIGVWELDIETGHLIWNDRMLEIFGTSRGSLTNTARDWSERLHPDEAPALIAKLKSCIEERQGFNGKFRIVTPDGKTKILKASSDFIKNDVTNSTIMIGTNVDITDQENLIAELAGAKDLAERSSKAKSEFLASMSHELRTPMNAILGYAQLLQAFADERLNGKDKEYIGHILDSGRHLLSLINDVLDFAQLGAGKLSLNLEEIGIEEIVSQALTMIEPLATKKEIGIERDCLLPCDPMICADKLRTVQILLNFLSNAVKFSPAGKSVVVSARLSDPGKVRLSVTDFGEGIGAEDQKRLFQPFTSLGRNPMVSGGGAGIGLAISKLLADQLGASIGVTSTPGLGSTFWVEFDLA